MNSCSKTGSVKLTDVDLDNLARAVYKAKKVIALGAFASDALYRLGAEHYKLPHPSPLNRQINDAAYVQKCLKECKRYIYNV